MACILNHMGLQIRYTIITGLALSDARIIEVNAIHSPSFFSVLYVDNVFLPTPNTSPRLPIPYCRPNPLSPSPSPSPSLSLSINISCCHAPPLGAITYLDLPGRYLPATRSLLRQKLTLARSPKLPLAQSPKLTWSRQRPRPVVAQVGVAASGATQATGR